MSGGQAPDHIKLMSEFQNVIGYTFNDVELLKVALTHRSFAKSDEHNRLPSNERLEFLGDSVLGLITAEHLYKVYPKKYEGGLTKFKALLVNEITLCRQAKMMGLGNFILLSRDEFNAGGKNRTSILADAFEAVLGAIYLDGGLDPAKSFVKKYILDYSEKIAADKTFRNYKGDLLEYLQGRGEGMPRYEVAMENGPDHNKLFTVDVFTNGKAIGSGSGPSKKEAEQKAASEALKYLGKK